MSKYRITDFSRNYFIITLFLAASLPLSIFTTSLAEILLLINWIAEGNFQEKFKILRKNKGALIVSFLYLLHLLGLINTQDFQYAFHDLKIKIPLFLLPLLMGSSPILSERRIRTVMLVFSSAVIISTLISASIFFGLINYEYYDFRDISIFISHIRLSLMVNISIFALLYYVFNDNTGQAIRVSARISLFFGAVWLIIFLLILKSITGIGIFIVLVLFHGWMVTAKIRMVAPKFIARVFIITIPLIIASWISHAWITYSYREPVDFNKLEILSPEGNPYFHDTSSVWAENGHFVWLYVCEVELREEWNKRSTLDYDGKDKMGQRLSSTLIRYMTSKGLRKDKAGILQLEDEDITAIENGVANHIFLRKLSLYPRIYQIIWEIDNYRKGNNPSGHSVTQRLEYNNAAFHIIKNNLFFGVGTGDIQKEFDNYYKESNTPLKKESRRRAHNQYHTFLIAFGLTGFILGMLSLFIPVFIAKKWKDYLFQCFALTGFISMLNEDTLETQTGVSFFIFFYSLLLFARKNGGSDT